MIELTAETLPSLAGKELGVSSWVTVDQKMIDAFADTTRDWQWIHVDVDRANRESPYGMPIAHGYLTLSLISGMAYEIGIMPASVKAAFNYGLDKVRFISPVRVNSRLRLRAVLSDVEAKGPGTFLLRCTNTMEIEGEDKPALVAETLTMLVWEG